LALTTLNEKPIYPLMRRIIPCSFISDINLTEVLIIIAEPAFRRLTLADEMNKYLTDMGALGLEV